MKTSNRFFSMIRHFVWTVFAVVFFIPASGQHSFFNQYSGPQPPLGGVYCNGGVTPNRSAYYSNGLNYMLETDLAGNVRWGREFSYNNSMLGIMCLEDRAAGGFYGGGFVYDQALLANKNIIFRLDTSGNTIWAKEVQLNTGSAHLVRLAATADGGLGICATFMLVNGQGGAWVGKTDSLGNLLWGTVIRHGSLNNVSGRAIAPTRDGGFIVTSRIMLSNDPTPHTGLSRLDANGNLLWTKTVAGSGANDWSFTTQCADGGFALAGCGTSFATDGFRLCKTDSLGNLLWATGYFYLPATGFAQKVQETADHGFIISGNVLDMTTLEYYPLLVRTDSLGDMRWARKFVFSNFCGGYSWDVQETPDGGFLLPSADLSLIKTDPNGDISCVSFPVTVIEVDTLVSQTSSLDFANGGSVVPATIGNNLLPFTDTTNCAGEFSPTAITVHDVTDELYVYPNPSEGVFTLQFENGISAYDVTVYNAIGQLVRSYKNNSPQLVIDLRTADAGIYFVRITGETGKRSSTVKLLKR